MARNRSNRLRQSCAVFCALFFLTAGFGLARQPQQIAQRAQIGQGIALFVPAGYNPAKTPSLALETAPKEQGSVPTNWSLTPEFSFENGKASAAVSIPKGTSLYGTGEVTGPLLRNG